jgi:hypothetical protein
MKTITIKVTVNDREWELLQLGKMEAPDPQRVKMMLLSNAASNLRRLTEEVMRMAHGTRTNSAAELREINRKRVQQRRAISALLEHKQPKLPVLNRKPKRIPLDGDKRKLPMKTDASAQPDWLDDDNIDKLRN